MILGEWMGFRIPVDVDYFDHDKTAQLMAILGPEADVYPLRLWARAAKCAKNGMFKSREAIEVGIKWHGKRGMLVAALIKTGFLQPDGVTIHDWMDGAGQDVAAYEVKKAKQREEYRKKHGILLEEFQNPSNGQKKNSVKNSAQQQTTTEQHRTTQNQTPPPTPSSPPATDAAVPLPEGSAVDSPDYGLGMSLLLSVGVSDLIATDLAVQYSVRRIFNVCKSAEGRRRPGGHVRDALQKNWSVPDVCPQSVEDELRAKQDARKKDQEVSKKPKTERHSGESEDAWLLRVQNEQRAAKVKAPG